MDISTNIEKVFGEEIAKLYSSKISEEDLYKTAEEVFKKITVHPYSYGNYHESELEKLIQKLYLEKLAGAVNSILSQPRIQEEIQKEAEEIVKEAKKVAHEKLVNRISDGLAHSATYSFDIADLSASIQNALFSLRNR